MWRDSRLTVDQRLRFTMGGFPAPPRRGRYRRKYRRRRWGSSQQLLTLRMSEVPRHSDGAPGIPPIPGVGLGTWSATESHLPSLSDSWRATYFGRAGSPPDRKSDV